MKGGGRDTAIHFFLLKLSLPTGSWVQQHLFIKPHSPFLRLSTSFSRFLSHQTPQTTTSKTFDTNSNMLVDTTSLSGHGQTVCVTGAGGFIASWIVKLLLEKGYTVKGTVRNPDDPKNIHLRELEGAEERLILCRADLLDYEMLKEAIAGCDGVVHTASPVTDDPEQMVEPAVNGTKNVIIAAAEAKVRRVVFTSSIGAVYMDPTRSSDDVVDESCWSDLDFCKNTKNWYCYGKAVAEKAAWEGIKERNHDTVVEMGQMLAKAWGINLGAPPELCANMIMGTKGWRNYQFDCNKEGQNFPPSLQQN